MTNAQNGGAEPRLLEILGINEAEERAYRWLLGHPRATTAEAARALELSTGKAQRLLDAIEAKGLVTNSPERPRRYIPAAPDIAVEALVRRKRECLDRAQLVIPDLQQHVAREVEDQEQMVELITSHEGGRQTLEHLQAVAQHEIVTLIRSPMLISRLDLPVEQEQKSQRKAQARGVRFRSIVDAEFLTYPGLIDVIRADMAAGEEVRVFPHLPIKMALTDRRLALIPLDLQQLSSPVLLVRSSALLDALYTLFEFFWERSSPLLFSNAGELQANDAEGPLSKDMGDVLALLSAGLNDKNIAHELGISTRSLERRVAELMQHLGTRTRFQTGWLAALRQYGLTSES